MKYLLFAATLLLISACTDPSVNAGVRISPSGVKVVPTVSGRVGNVGVSVAP